MLDSWGYLISGILDAYIYLHMSMHVYKQPYENILFWHVVYLVYIFLFITDSLRC